MNRISKDEYYLGIADGVLKRSTCLRRHYGVVIVKDDEIVATATMALPEVSLTVATAGIVFARSSTFLAARTMNYVWRYMLRIMLLPLQVERSAKAQRST